MRVNLEYIELQSLRKLTRAGYIIGVSIVLVSFAIYVGIKFSENEQSKHAIYVLASGIIIGILMIWAINRKYWMDIKNGEKEIMMKVIRKKEHKIDYEAGSSTGYSITGEDSPFYLGMKPTEKFYFVIDKYRHEVDKEMWSMTNEGDEVEMHVAPKSQEIFLIRLKK